MHGKECGLALQTGLKSSSGLTLCEASELAVSESAALAVKYSMRPPAHGAGVRTT